MNTTYKRTLMAAAVGLACLGAVGSAQANVLATAMIDMTNFLIKDAPGGNVVTNGNQITVTNFASSADQDVLLNGFGSLANNNPGSTTGINFAPICVGPGCNPILPDNTFPGGTMTGPALTSYAAADQLEAGAPINGLPGLASPAHVANGAYIGIDDTIFSAGSANSNNTLNVQYVFQVSQNGILNFSFDARTYLEAFVSASEPFGGLGTFADASTSFVFRITDRSAGGAVVFDWNPDGLVGNIHVGTEHADGTSLNETVSCQPLPPGFGNCVDTDGGLKGADRIGAFSADTLALTAGHLYQLNGTMEVTANAQRIPEPASIALMGAGLMGMVVGLRRRRNKSA